MKIDIGNQTQERRKKRYIMPIVYFVLELTLAWLILALVNVNFVMSHWNNFSYAALLLVSGYSLFKMYKVFDRQKNYKEA